MSLFVIFFSFSLCVCVCVHCLLLSMIFVTCFSILCLTKPLPPLSLSPALSDCVPCGIILNPSALLCIYISACLGNDSTVSTFLTLKTMNCRCYFCCCCRFVAALQQFIGVIIFILPCVELSKKCANTEKPKKKSVGFDENTIKKYCD